MDFGMVECGTVDFGWTQAVGRQRSEGLFHLHIFPSPIAESSACLLALSLLHALVSSSSRTLLCPSSLPRRLLVWEGSVWCKLHGEALHRAQFSCSYPPGCRGVLQCWALEC